MPLYEYVCESCGHRFEVIVKFSDPPIEVCPKCGSRVQKQLSSPAIQFKGTGWYITDYAKKSGAEPGKSADKSDEKPAEKSAEKSADTSDGKPAGSSDTTPSTKESPSPSPSSKDASKSS